MASVKLSPKYGVNPTIPVCFWCGNERNEIAFMGKLGDGRNGEDFEAPRYAVIDYEPCDKCRAAMEAGFTIMEATTSPNPASSVGIQDGIYPTGRFMVITKSSAERMFGDIAKANAKAFIDTDLFSRMIPND